MLKTRIYTAAVLLVLFCGALFGLPQAGWALALAPLLLGAAWEWGVLARWSPAVRWLYLALMTLVTAGLWFAGAVVAGWALWGAAALWFVFVPLWLVLGWRVRPAPLLAAAGLLLLVPLWLALVQLHDRAALMLLLLAIPWISDTAAYACGRRWGRRKLAPSISPGKTWEGACGAAVAVALYYGLLQWVGVELPHPMQGVTGLAVFMLLMVLGMEGDLFESWVKRTAGVKDSGTWLPGHGGVLDRVDALTAAMPIAVLLMEQAR